jgi:uncharacterized SAM-binding protein YcdF (DUF218 family)
MKTLAILLSLFSGVLLGSVAFLWMGAGEIYDYEDTFLLAQDAAQTDVVLCLAGGKHRIPVAVELWQKIRPLRKMDEEPILFLSGVGPQAGMETLKEQGISKEVLTQFNRDNVIFENVSENTFENAQLFSSFARQKKWKHVVLVTAGYHMRRADFILHRVLDPDIEVTTYTVDAVHFDRNQWHKDAYAVRVTLIEYIKWLYYRYSYG